MNLGLLMNVSSSGMPFKSCNSIANNEGEGFGSVFQGLVSASAVPVKQQIVGTNSELTTLVDDVLNTDSLEKLEEIVEELKQSVKSPVVAQLLKESRLLQAQLVKEATVKKKIAGIVEEKQLQDIPVSANEDVEIKLTDIVDLQKFPSLQQLAHQISEDPDKLIETITNVLEDAGMTKEQFDKLAATGDIWFALDVLQQLPTANIKEVMGQLPSKSAVELIALLKAVELAAAKMDLFTKQVDLVKTIQPILSQFASQLEYKIIQPEVKLTVQIPPTMQHVIRISTEQMSADTEQQNQQSKPNETVAPLSAVTPTETRPVFQMTATEKGPESRSEALMREFQAILNRANFGQTNGKNRISVKLYPEHLGQIRIELLEVNGVMTARILVSTAVAREMLDSQMHQLRQAFNQQNMQVDRIDLSQTLQDPSKSDREQAFNKQNQPHPPTMQQVIRISTEQMSEDTERQNQQSKPSETVAPLSAVTPTETRPVFQMTATEKGPESRSEALMREFQAILNRSNFGQTNGMNRISVKLYPEHLGQIRIELLEVNGVMTARILVSTAMAREMLDSQMHQLRQAFNQQNMQVDRIDLSQTLQDPSKSDREQAFNKQNQQQKEQTTEQNENSKEQEQTFQEFMIELEA